MEKMFFITRKEMLKGYHIVHTENCPFMTDRTDLIFLGTFRSVCEALLKGMNLFSKVEECPFCSGCHRNSVCNSVRHNKRKSLVPPTSDCDNYDFMICCKN